MSDTNTKKNKDKAARHSSGRSALYGGSDLKPRRKAGGLTLRILSVNMLPLLVLVVGLLSLGRYQDSLISENLKTLQERAHNFAVAIESSESRALAPEGVAVTLRKLSQNRADMRIRLLDLDGRIIADTHRLQGPGGVVQIDRLDAPRDSTVTLSGILAYLGTEMLERLPTSTALPEFPASFEETNLLHFPDVKNAISGEPSASAWESQNSNSHARTVLSAAAPVIKNGNIAGVLLVTDNGRDIEAGMDRVRFDVLTATLLALSMTIFMSIYLASVIGRPLRKLANAAEAVRRDKAREVTIPDMSKRRDEIGELSMALRDMTQALWSRMDSIERFAADVAHEIKNPLTSVQSAVETAAKVKNEKDRAKLMEIIHHDVQRLDRLISDISKASRLDAELSRDEMGKVDLRALLQHLADARKDPMQRAGHKTKAPVPVILEAPRGREMYVRGNEGRLAQVFENLITNALSFSPPEGIVTLRLSAPPKSQQIIVEIEDQGPGIPENKLETIFDRFYSERPKAESYGRHSGLGLSIAKQIIEAHGGEIYAENIKAGDQVLGARFTVILNKYS